MRYIPLFAAGVVLSIGSAGLAAPATLPVDPVPVPVPQPPALEQPTPASPESPAPQSPPANPTAAVVPAPANDGSILVLPFVELTASTHPWVPKAIQQDLVVDLVRTTRARIQAPGDTPPAVDTDAAIQEGRKVGASHVVYGQLQTSGGQMRATGQVLDVATGKAVGGFSATASPTDLFPLEDSVAGQVLRALPASWVTVPLPPLASGASAQTNAQPYTSAPPPSATPAQDYYSYTYPDYASGPGMTYSSTYWGYPYYWYAVPYYGPDFFFYGGWDHFHNHYWGHVWDHGYSGHYYGGFHPNAFHGYSHAPSSGGFHGGGGAHGGGGGHR